MKQKKLFTLSSALVISFLFPISAVSADDIKKIFEEGHFTGQARYRYEQVRQDGPLPVDKTAHASTIRLNLGYKTGVYKGLSSFIEGQYVGTIGQEVYNDTVNKNSSYPVVADPKNAELNQLWIKWEPRSDFYAQVGRQGINIDNQRFIGTVDWRQNDQTFDSLRLNYIPADEIALQYGTIWKVHRVFGRDHAQGELTSHSHFAHLSYNVSPLAHLKSYGYWLDFDETPQLSSQTLGASLSGVYTGDNSISFPYHVEYAHQKDFKDNPNSASHDYFHVYGGIKNITSSLTLGFEKLGGDGTSAFQTPLATLHRHNGWADKFLNTPNSGLNDYYVAASHSLSSGNFGAFDKTRFDIAFHDFRDDDGIKLGYEWDISASKSFDLPENIGLKKIDVLLKYANYQAKSHQTDTQKLWLGLNVPF